MTVVFNRPFARSGHMVRNKLHWDASYAVGLSKQRKVGLDWYEFLCCGSPTACDRIAQRAYSALKIGRASSDRRSFTSVSVALTTVSCHGFPLHFTSTRCTPSCYWVERDAVKQNCLVQELSIRNTRSSSYTTPKKFENAALFQTAVRPVVHTIPSRKLAELFKNTFQSGEI